MPKRKKERKGQANPNASGRFAGKRTSNNIQL
jgi:hypothetical protein